ncbi:MAG TPA: RecX family transcriptional regulator [Anaeromyxobacteraceae bacterium]|nr:RecX family transcriptional regulator [Anaeromyxobacteraceae bacterium]
MSGTDPGSLQTRARARALRLLAARPRTEAQLRDRLNRAGFAEVAEETIAWVRGFGYVDDRAFARDRARALLDEGRVGPRLAEQRLVAAGIPRQDARDAVRQAIGDTEAARCRTLALRRARGPVDALDDRSRARLTRFLLARGFSGNAVSRALGVHVDEGEDR